MSKVKQKQMNRRAEIIETLIPLIGNVPFDELSVADLCEAAGISIGTFYHYFNKKSGLLVGLLGLIDDYMVSDVFPLLTSGDEIENLLTFAHGWAVYVGSHGLERSKLITSAEPSDSYVSGQRRVTSVKLEEIFARGQEKGQITSDHDAGTLTRYFLLTLRGVTADWSRRDGGYPVVEMMDSYISLFARALRVGSARRATRPERENRGSV